MARLTPVAPISPVKLHDLNDWLSRLPPLADDAASFAADVEAANPGPGDDAWVSSMAAAQRAYEITVAYVNERKAFGQPIAAFQNTRFKLADLKTELLVGWAFVDQCLDRHERGELDTFDASAAKLWCSEMHGRMVDACVQLHGGYGFMREYEICRLYADARVQRIYGGTSEIMRELISRNL
ncbi:MAG: hypothetical protein L0H83_03950 [Salinisphaera sp.]|nr:hypothetical protein [Salinisphaera sp.]